MARTKKKAEAKPVKKVSKQKMLLETISEDEVDEVPPSQTVVTAQVHVPPVKRKRKIATDDDDDDDVVPPSQVPVVVRKGRKQPPSAALGAPPSSPPSSPSPDEEVDVPVVKKQPPKKKLRVPKPKVEPYPFTIGQIEELIDL